MMTLGQAQKKIIPRRTTTYDSTFKNRSNDEHNIQITIFSNFQYLVRGWSVGWGLVWGWSVSGGGLVGGWGVSGGLVGGWGIRSGGIGSRGIGSWRVSGLVSGLVGGLVGRLVGWFAVWGWLISLADVGWLGLVGVSLVGGLGGIGGLVVGGIGVLGLSVVGDLSNVARVSVDVVLHGLTAAVREKDVVGTVGVVSITVLVMPVVIVGVVILHGPLEVVLRWVIIGGFLVGSWLVGRLVVWVVSKADGGKSEKDDELEHFHSTVFPKRKKDK
jgi:hypothetical protein